MYLSWWLALPEVGYSWTHGGNWRLMRLLWILKNMVHWVIRCLVASRSRSSWSSSGVMLVRLPYSAQINRTACRWIASSDLMSLAVWGFHAAVAYSNCGRTRAWYARSLMFLEHGPRLRRITPRVLEAFDLMLAICFFQVRSLDIVTPKYLWSYVLSMSWLETV